MDINWQQLGILVVMILPVLLVLGLVLTVLYLGLSDEQRYGIDEYGIAKTPKYMKEKAESEARGRPSCDYLDYPY